MNHVTWKTVAAMCACCLAAALAARSVYAIEGLELHYTFDDEQNPTSDSSGNERHGELDDLGVTWMNDAERGGGVMQFEGANNGFIAAEIPELPPDNFTIAFWAYRDPLYAGDTASGANDGMFQVQDGGFEPATSNKVLGGWVNKSSFAVWGRIIQDNATAMNLDQASFTMEDEAWTHFAYRGDGSQYEVVVNGQSGEGPAVGYDGTLMPHSMVFVGKQGTETWGGRLDDFRVYSRALTDEEIAQVMAGTDGGGAVMLQAGDADMDLDFDQLDLVKVQIAAKYLTGQAATWGDGDWDGAPGGEVGGPPVGDGQFNQLDIIAALSAGFYLQGSYAALSAGGAMGDAQTSVGYDANTGRVWVDPPAGKDLTSINIESAASIFTGDAAENLGGSFDNDADNNIFKATFGGSFGAISFGNVAQAGLSEQFVRDDLTVVGSLAGGGDLGSVDLLYVPVPEPSALVLLLLAVVSVGARWSGYLWQARGPAGQSPSM